MKQSDLRKWHRRMGIALALFIILQAGSGVLISLSRLWTPHSHAHTESVTPASSHDEEESVRHGFLGFIHHGAGSVGSVYRVLLGIGAVALTLSGGAIFFKGRTRLKKGTSVTSS